MALADNLIADLEKNEEYMNSGKPYLNYNEDYDFDAVLNEVGGSNVRSHSFRYYDGTAETFSFDNLGGGKNNV